MSPRLDVPAPSELLMPVTDDHALRQFEIEALRQITDNLRRLNDTQSEQGKVLHNIDNRLIRIEANSVGNDVAELKLKVDELERDRDKRDGAIGAYSWLLKNWPAILAVIGLALIVLGANGKLH